jgi:TolB protein
VLGGSPTKIADKAYGGSVSPDGKTIVFIREGDESTTLMLANADGSNERILVKGQPNWVNSIFCGGVPAWSSDGKTIACWQHFSDKKNEIYWRLIRVSVADGSQQILSEQKWDIISGAVWMPDGNLIVTGRENSAEWATPQQIWLIAPNTAPKRITNDLDGYSKISATAKGDVLVTLQPKLMRDLWILPDNDASRARQVTFTGEIGGGARWMPDGKLVFCSKIGGNNDIWTMNADGTNRKRLTNNPGGNIAPIVSPDGRYIYFQSPRVDWTLHLFRMDADGSNVKQLTDGARQRWAQISPDGKWVYYNQIPQNEIRKIPSEGGEPVVLATAPKGTVFDYIDVSRVNGLIAYRLIATEQNLLQLNHKIFIISPDGAPIKTLDLPPTSQQNPPQVSTKFFHWTPDGRSIAFNDSRNNWANIWSIPVDGSEKEKPLTNFTTELTQNFDWSPDGKQLLVIRGIETTNGVIITRAE